MFTKQWPLLWLLMLRPTSSRSSELIMKRWSKSRILTALANMCAFSMKRMKYQYSISILPKEYSISYLEMQLLQSLKYSSLKSYKNIILQTKRFFQGSYFWWKIKLKNWLNNLALWAPLVKKKLWSNSLKCNLKGSTLFKLQLRSKPRLAKRISSLRVALLCSKIFSKSKKVRDSFLILY